MKLTNWTTIKRFCVSAAWTGLVAGAGLSVGCKPASNQGAGPGAGAGGPPPATPVTVASVEAREIVEWEEFTGRTAPVEFVEVRPRVSGHIREVKFKSGQLVRKGDVLFTIDPRWQQAELDRREAELAVTRARLQNAEREAERIPKLLESKAISKEEADSREARFLEAKASLLVAEAARNTARLDLEYTEVRSPIDGQTSRAWITEGNYVSGTAGMAAVLTTVVSVDPIHVYVDMDEGSLLRFKQMLDAGALPKDEQGRTPVELQLGSETAFSRKGHVESLDNRLDPASGSIVLRAVVPNPDGKIVPGLFARLKIPLSGKKPVILVDESAVGTDQARKFVLSVTSTNTVAYRPIVTGPMFEGRRVVRQGLQPGEKIIVNGMARVRPGMPVAPTESTNTHPSVAAANSSAR